MLCDTPAHRVGNPRPRPPPSDCTRKCRPFNKTGPRKASQKEGIDGEDARRLSDINARHWIAEGAFSTRSDVPRISERNAHRPFCHIRLVLGGACENVEHRPSSHCAGQPSAGPAYRQPAQKVSDCKIGHDSRSPQSGRRPSHSQGNQRDGKK